MKILAVETSTDACSAALFVDGEIQEKFAVSPREHTKLILPMIAELMAAAQLKPQQLNAIALSRGPGSFTGVRIAGGVVQGLALGADLPVVPVSTLAALAQDCFNQHAAAQLAYTAMDARMAEIFWGIYQRNHLGLAELSGAEAVGPAAEAFSNAGSGYGVGSGWPAYQAQLNTRLGGQIIAISDNIYPKAAAVAQLGAYGYANGQAVPVEEAMPVYLRDKVAQTQQERNQAKNG